MARASEASERCTKIKTTKGLHTPHHAYDRHQPLAPPAFVCAASTAAPPLHDVANAMSSADLNLNATLGCTFIGIVFEVVLYGFSCAQTQYYFHEYWTDKTQLRALVAFLWVLDTVRTILDIQYMWLYIVTNHANRSALQTIPTTFTVEFLLSSVTVLVVQTYFIRAIYRFLIGKWYFIPLIGPLTVIALLSFAGGCASVAEFARDPGFNAILFNSRIPASIQTVAAFVADVYIAIALSVILYGKKTGFKNTDTLVSRLVTYAIHRGLFTALLQLLHFATYIATLQYGASELIWSLFHFPASKVYVNSLLALYVPSSFPVHLTR
ncbi:uncharacterized protein C8Q71DRAFT_790277 [Rhodofomes roseus]|uniref:DUF6534 domain-containing protein n=1 Tax=Rhodofomes roseus TaxID=34475 RepID=A0ABQ8JYZ3_9APHY|nr:uncharacterized protein C8Q71DRAFT_790277 [Rhodofomes roseus]KAH9829455.1 hypothetical protein C8Q71DRAFT_790277 [Rhodofomes roseus]